MRENTRLLMMQAYTRKICRRQSVITKVLIFKEKFLSLNHDIELNNFMYVMCLVNLLRLNIQNCIVIKLLSEIHDF